MVVAEIDSRECGAFTEIHGFQLVAIHAQIFKGSEIFDAFHRCDRAYRFVVFGVATAIDRGDISQFLLTEDTIAICVILFDHFTERGVGEMGGVQWDARLRGHCGTGDSHER